MQVEQKIADLGLQLARSPATTANNVDHIRRYRWSWMMVEAVVMAGGSGGEGEVYHFSA